MHGVNVPKVATVADDFPPCIMVKHHQSTTIETPKNKHQNTKKMNTRMPSPDEKT